MINLSLENPDLNRYPFKRKIYFVTILVKYIMSFINFLSLKYIEPVKDNIRLSPKKRPLLNMVS